jgi:GH24 family phage-related lysozyme (muramidase)
MNQSRDLSSFLDALSKRLSGTGPDSIGGLLVKGGPSDDRVPDPASAAEPTLEELKRLLNASNRRSGGKQIGSIRLAVSLPKTDAAPLTQLSAKNREFVRAWLARRKQPRRLADGTDDPAGVQNPQAVQSPSNGDAFGFAPGQPPTAVPTPSRPGNLYSDPDDRQISADSNPPESTGLAPSNRPGAYYPVEPENLLNSPDSSLPSNPIPSPADTSPSGMATDAGTVAGRTLQREGVPMVPPALKWNGPFYVMPSLGDPDWYPPVLDPGAKAATDMGQFYAVPPSLSLAATYPERTGPKSPDVARELEDPETGEGFSTHLYADSNGVLTIGAGLTDKAIRFTSLPFVYKGTHILAKSEDIAAEAKRVNAFYKTFVPSSDGSAGKPAAAAYDKITQLAVDPDVLRNESVRHIEELNSHLTQHFLRDLYSYPPPAQRAILDYAYNRGFQGFFNQIPLKDAVRARDWVAASRYSGRQGVNAKRNEKVRNLFLQAAQLDSVDSK